MCGCICNGCDVAGVRAECICVAVYATVVMLLWCALCVYVWPYMQWL
jgi:hypothetical protein